MKLTRRQVQLSDDVWMELALQAAVERTPGRGDIVRRALRRYLDETHEQRLGAIAQRRVEVD